MRLLLILTMAGLLAACADKNHDHGDTIAAQHAGDSTQATPVVDEPRQPVESREVQYGTHTGFLVTPVDTSEVKGGLIMIHEWWGLNDNVRAMARRYAGEGYTVLAVDLYGGRVAETPDSARAFYGMATGDIPGVRANVTEAYQYLARRGTEDVGILGWCMGGLMALQGALALPDRIDATVIYYGDVSGFTTEELRTLQMPVRGFFGAEDGGIPVETVHAFEQRLRQAGVAAEITLYPGAGHAFANPTGNNYQPGPAQDSWEETLTFLKTHLGDA